MDDARLPTGLLVDLVCKRCEIDFIPFYILQKGEYASGVVLAKLNALDGRAALRVQQRDFLTGDLGWVDALPQAAMAEGDADAYITRARNRDPDLWVIEFECRDLLNPFEIYSQ